MQIKLLGVLACPTCQGELTVEQTETQQLEEIITGNLRCAGCRKTYPIQNGIPRFVSVNNYASSFGLQWNLFRVEQIDSLNGFKLSEERFFTETGWSREWLRGKWILDAGCGAGRFMDVVSQVDCQVVGLDLSNAVDAARANLAGRKNVHLVQASIYELPFRPGVFDGCYCLGVIQHTPDPHRALRTLPKVLKHGGRIGFFIYERKRWTLLYSKYLIRPLTKRLPSNVLLAVLKATMPVFFPLTEITFRIPYLGRLFNFAIPVSNYAGVNGQLNRGLTWRQRYRWALMDTFDMLAPQYDQPQTQEEVFGILREAGIVGLRRTAHYGLSVEGRKE